MFLTQMSINFNVITQAYGNLIHFIKDNFIYFIIK